MWCNYKVRLKTCKNYVQTEDGKRPYPCKAVFLAGDSCVMRKVYTNIVIPVSYTMVRTLRKFLLARIYHVKRFYFITLREEIILRYNHARIFANSSKTFWTNSIVFMKLSMNFDPLDFLSTLPIPQKFA